MAKKSSKSKLKHPLVIAVMAFAILFAIFVGIYYSSNKPSQIVYGNAIATPDSSTWKTYSNSVAGFKLDYPDNWTVNEFHSMSNREVDDPKEINTVLIKNGNENEIVIQWGPMGFGGGCNEEDSSYLKLKEETIKICKGAVTRLNEPYNYNFEGEKIYGTIVGISQIYPNATNNEIPIGAFSFSTPSELGTIEKIFSTFETMKPTSMQCGGFAGRICPNGYRCKLDGNYPDAGGNCVKKDLLHWNY